MIHNVYLAAQSKKLVAQTQAEQFYRYLKNNKISNTDQLDFNDIKTITTLFLVKSLSKYIVDTNFKPQIIYSGEDTIKRKLDMALWIGKNSELWDQLIKEV